MTSSLPQPNEGFAWVQAAHAPALVCTALEASARHLFTTRVWLPSAAADPEEAGGWVRVAQAMEVDATRLVRLHQVHGAAVVHATAPRSERPRADIAIADTPALALAVQAADCVPLLIGDIRTGGVAAAHAGWRGMVARVPVAAVDALRSAFGSTPADLVGALGPSIGACCYEVGPDVREAFAAAGFDEATLARWFLPTPAADSRNPPMAGIPPHGRPGRWFFDGWRAVRDQLEIAGVPASQIHEARLCTASHPAVFHSYRRDGAAAGRLAGVIRSRRRP